MASLGEGGQGTLELMGKQDKGTFAGKDSGSKCPPISDPHLKEFSSEPSAEHLSRALGATTLNLDLVWPKKQR